MVVIARGMHHRLGFISKSIVSMFWPAPTSPPPRRSLALSSPALDLAQAGFGTLARAELACAAQATRRSPSSDSAPRRSSCASRRPSAPVPSPMGIRARACARRCFTPWMGDDPVARSGEVGGPRRTGGGESAFQGGGHPWLCRQSHGCRRGR
uniref:Uncharacterized protein n=1 Tax=Setaria italica TaxID=4555 RepID=K3ZXQ3_SETIT